MRIHNIIKENSTSNVARSPTRSKKQDNRKSSGGGGWRQQGEGFGQIGNIGGVFIKEGG